MVVALGVVVMWGECPARATGATPIARAADKKGAFQVTLSEHSPHSKAAELSKRCSLKPADIPPDYNLSSQVFEVYVPKRAGKGGAYGLIVPLQAEGIATPPDRWVPVLEKYHLIWIGASQNGAGNPPAQQVQLMLDAVHNAQKTWHVEDGRVYALLETQTPPGDGVPIYFPDVFDGAIHCTAWTWFGPIRTRQGVYTPTTVLPRPEPKDLGLAKSRGRFFFATLAPDEPGAMPMSTAIVRQGYQASGFEHVKLALLPREKMNSYFGFTADWFEEAIQFLDAPLAAQTAGAKASGHTAAPAPAASPDDEASRTVNLAKSYIAAQRYGPARARLQRVIQTAPSSPAAAEAKKLLAEIQGK